MNNQAGLGWALTCELQITRTINGTDDFFSKGYINNNLRNTIPYPFIKNTGYLRCPSENVYNIASGDVDGMPDKFSYQLLGKSGSFFFDQGSGGTFNFIPVPYDNIKITFANDRFIITDTDGTTYYFEEKEKTGDAISVDGSCINCHTTAWKCSRIVSNVGIPEITFTYSPKTVKKYQTKTDCNEYYSAVYYYGSLDFGNYYRSDLLLFSQSSIYTPSQYPLFRVSNPKYIEFFANGQSPLLHVPYYNEAQKVLVDKTYDSNQLNPTNNPYNNQSSVQGFSIFTIEFRGGKVTFNNADKLTQISITDKKNSSVKSIQLFHSYQAPIYLESAKNYNGYDFLGTMYLDSIRLSNNGTAFERYVFLYNSKYCFGNHLVGHDAWGYPNAYTREINYGNMYSMPAITNDETFYLDLGGWGNSKKSVSFQTHGSDWALAPSQEYQLLQRRSRLSSQPEI